jgi:hypothetical protein
MEFDQVTLTNWVNMCSEERVLRDSGASNDELKAMRIQIIMGMVDLLPGLSSIQRSSLLVTLVSGEFAAADMPLPSTMSDEDRVALAALLSLGQGQGQGQIQIQGQVDVSDPIEQHNYNDTASECVSDVCED